MRRISKRRQGATKGIAGYDYQWSGDRLVAETPVYADGTAATAESVYWLYEPGALTPGARYEKGQLHYVVRDHMGTPRELLTESGEVVWAQKLSVWGRSERYRFGGWNAANDEDGPGCPWCFAGQWEDEESGLYYNRFRYYDSEAVQYLTPDPIGLGGGINPFGYVDNPLKYIDPLGLCKGEIKNTFPDNIFSQKAPVQVIPGTRVLEGQYINDQNKVQPWIAHYDEYGRLTGRTDYNAGNKAHGIPDVHCHTYEWGPGKKTV